MKEKLQEYALVAEIVSAIAIIASLIFVGLEIRKNTLVSQAATFQESVANDVQILLGAGSNLDSARIYLTFINDPDSLNEDERMQGVLLLGAAIRHVENIYLQYVNGMLSEQTWEARESLVKSVISSPGFHMSMTEYFPSYMDGRFAKYVEEIKNE